MTPAADGERPWLIDGRALDGFSGVRGIGTYLRSLLAAYAELGVASRVLLLTERGATPGPATASLGLRQGPAVRRVKRRLQPLLDPLLVSVALRRSHPALYHAIEWAQPLIAGGVPVVLTIHDLIPFLYPREHVWVRRERLLALRQARHADAVVVPSRATAGDVERLGHVDPARITVIPHGVDASFRPATEEAVDAVRRRLGLADEPYLLTTGTLDPRKRRDLLARAVAALRRDTPVRLVIAGDQGIFLPLVDRALAEAGIAAQTVLPGFVSHEELVALYSGAAAFVFPSAYEGFGLPLLEAMACGTPVVAFDNSAHPEVAGDAAELVADGDLPAFTTAIERVLAEPAAIRATRVERGRARAATFEWRASAEAHLRLYRSLAA